MTPRPAFRVPSSRPAIVALACVVPALASAAPARTATTPDRHAIVADCAGVVNPDWLAPGTSTPVKGELTLTALTLPGTRKIVGFDVRILIPDHTVAGSDALVPATLHEAEDADIAFLTTRRIRGSLLTRVSPSPAQTLRITSAGETTLATLTSFEFNDGDGASFVDLTLDFVPRGVDVEFTEPFTFETCEIADRALLEANAP